MSHRTGNGAFARALIELLEPRWMLSTTHFAVVGDFGSPGQPELDVANRIKSWNPEYILTVGDNNYPSGAASTIDTNIGQYYHDYIGNYTGAYGAGSPGYNRFFPSLGNHDWGDIANNPTGANPYLAYFTLPGTPVAGSGFTLPSPNPNTNERYYTFIQGPVQFFAIDSDLNEPDGTTATSVQGTWLKNALAASTTPWQIVYFHHAAYTSTSRGNSTYMQWPFAQWGADAVIAGHDHTYERLSVNGIPYFVDGLGGASLGSFSTPLAGSQVRYASNYGAMLIDANDTSITYQFITRTGVVIDTYTVSNTPGVPAAPSGLTAAASTNAQIKLSWTDNATNETGFTIERSTNNVQFLPIASVLANTNKYVDDTELAPGTQYYYRVKATSVLGDSLYSPSASATTQPATQVSLIAAGSTWKYLDNGTDQGTAWRSSAFNDGSWLSGAAQLGYGDGDEATTVGFGPNSTSRYITTYFRQSFSISDASILSSLNLRLLRDDGAVLYLNGNEIFRSNMPTGTVGYQTVASTAVGGTDESTFFTAVLSSAFLVSGVNTLAVEIHQSGATSSDISFDLELTGVSSTGIPAFPTGLSATPVSSSQVNLAWTDASSNETGFSIQRKTGSGAWAQIGTTGAGVTSFASTGLSGNTAYSYRVVAMNAAGNSSYSSAVTVTTPSGANQPPTIAVPGASSPATVTGKTAVLSVLGADDAGEAALVYTWSVVTSPAGAAAPTFSVNGTNASKTSTVTFKAAGSYMLRATVKDAAGLTTTSNLSVTVQQTLTTLIVAPATATVLTNATQTFTAAARDQFGLTMPPPSIAWSVASGVGSISAGGVYSPGAFSGVATVKAASGSVSGTASVTVKVASSIFAGDADIGTISAGKGGSYSLSGSVYTLKGAGTDIWGTADSFHYVYQSLTGDGVITARVLSVQNTNTWAKAGVMIRNTLSANSSHAAIYVTRGSGVSSQWRTTAGGSSGSSTVAGLVAPYWVRLTRVGNTFKAERSSNGTTWTQVGTTRTIAMNTTVFIGLALTSHAAATVNTSTFGNVSITPTLALSRTASLTAARTTPFSSQLIQHVADQGDDEEKLSVQETLLASK